MTTQITFLGGAGTVTGSKYLVETGAVRVLVDCGLFQGYKQLRLRNWAKFAVEPNSIDAVILTHAHIDHSGYLPVLIREGFRGRVYCTAATRDLCAILLPDSGFLQERDAEFANRYGFTKHHPARPLYTQREGEAAVERFEPICFGEKQHLSDDVALNLAPAGHILGSATVELIHPAGTLVFSGDLGRPASPLMPPPAAIARADHLIVESTYGGRQHDQTDPESILADIVNRTAARGGTVLVPAFAVGRAQLVLYYLARLKAAARIPNLPIYLDSPMAIDASNIFCAHPHEHRLDEATCRATCAVARYTRDVEQSKDLDRSPMPSVIVSASGMATGGRVLHHLKHFAPDSRSAILFAGFQAGGTRGAAMVSGATRIKIHGNYYPMRAEVCSLDMLSAHADESEILDWLGQFSQPPQETFITHGEAAASDALRRRIEETLDWTCVVPEHGETRVLG